MKVIGNLTKDAIIRAAVSEGVNVTQAVGSKSVFESATVTYASPIFDSNAVKVVISYRDQGNSNYGTAVVGTVSDTSISFGTPVVFETADSTFINATFDSTNNKVVIFYKDVGNSNAATAIVGTVSGTSISFGAANAFHSASGGSGPSYISSTFDSNAGKVVVAYTLNAGAVGYATVGTVSGTSISFGTPVEFKSSASYNTATFDSSNNKVVIGYKSSDDSGRAKVGTVSGTSISFGSEVTFASSSTTSIRSTFDSTNNKVIFAYRDDGNSLYGTSVVGTVSGTSISFGSEVVFLSSQANVFGTAYDANAQRIIVYFKDRDNNSRGAIVVGTVSGTSISFGDLVALGNSQEATDATHCVTYDSINQRIVLAFSDEANSVYGTSIVFKTGYTSATGGTIADGKPVIVNANGTVSSIAGSATSAGSTVTFNAATTTLEQHGSVFDSSNNKVVVGYQDGGNSNYGTAIVGTIDSSDNSISFGSEVVFENAASDHISSTFDSNSNKVVFAYRDGGNSNYGTAVVGTVSGTAISFGTPVVFESADLEGVGITFDTNSNKVVISYCDLGGGQDGTAIVGTVSGTSISFGSAVKFEVGNVGYTSAVFDSSNNKVVISFSDAANNNYGTAVVGTVSGTSISFGSAVVFASEYTIFNPIVFDSSNNKVVISYREGQNDHGKAVVGTVSGTSISFGSAVTFNNSGTSEISAAFNTGSNKITIAYQDTGDSSKGTAIEGTVSGSSISFGTELVYQTDGIADNTLVYDSNANRLAVFYRQLGSEPRNGKSNVVQFGSTNVTSENFVGFMKGAALDGTNGEILSSCSIARNQASLTPGQTYFVTAAGALSTTAGDPSVKAGTAISSKELIVKG